MARSAFWEGFVSAFDLFPEPYELPQVSASEALAADFDVVAKDMWKAFELMQAELPDD